MSPPAPLSRRQSHAQREAEAARAKRLKARAALPSAYILNRHGATFGKAGAAPDPGDDARGRAIPLDDPFVSKRHFSVWGERGRWYVQDLGSLNGTFARRRRRVQAGEGGLDVERCVMAYGYGYEHCTQHAHEGYRLALHRAFLMGGVELMVTGLTDEEGADDPALHRLEVQYTAAPLPSSLSSPAADAAILTATVTREGATLGTSPSCTLVLSGPTLLPHHASIEYSDGRFYLLESPSPPSPASSPSCGVWSRLSLKSEESLPHLLCHGDSLRVGCTEFSVDIRAIPPSRSGGYGGGTSGALVLPKRGCVRYDVGACMEGNFVHTKEMQDRVVCVEGFAGDERNGFFAVFDGHQERTVADFAAASLHHNLLEEIAALLQHKAEPSTAPAQPAVEGGGEKEKGVAEVSVSHSGSIASATVTDGRYDEESRGSDGSISRSAQGGLSRHRRLDSDRSEARLGSYDQDEEGDEAEVSASASRRPPLSISINHDPASTSIVSPSSASSDSTASQQKPPSTPGPFAVSLDLPLAFTRAYRRTSAQIRGLSESALYSGSTAVTALLYHHPASSAQPACTTLTVANLGDSHAYLLSTAAMSELSYPHSARDPVEQRRVRAAGGKITQNNRLAGCLEVTRAFGDVGLAAFGLSDEPHIREVRIGDDDRWLVVCSDGVDVLGPRDIEAAVREGEASGWDADEVAREVVERALKRKSRDNISVIAVNLHPLSPQQLPGPSPVSPAAAAEMQAQTQAQAVTQLVTAPSPRHGKGGGGGLHLTLSPPSRGPEEVSSAKLSIVTEGVMAYDDGADHQSHSAPPAEEAEERGTQTQPLSGGGQWVSREGGWAREGQLDEEEEGLTVRLHPLTLNHSVSHPVGDVDASQRGGGDAFGRGGEEEGPVKGRSRRPTVECCNAAASAIQRRLRVSAAAQHRASHVVGDLLLSLHQKVSGDEAQTRGRPPRLFHSLVLPRPLPRLPLRLPPPVRQPVSGQLQGRVQVGVEGPGGGEQRVLEDGQGIEGVVRCRSALPALVVRADLHQLPLPLLTAPEVVPESGAGAVVVAGADPTHSQVDGGQDEPRLLLRQPPRPRAEAAGDGVEAVGVVAPEVDAALPPAPQPLLVLRQRPHWEGHLGPRLQRGVEDHSLVTPHPGEVLRPVQSCRVPALHRPRVRVERERRGGGLGGQRRLQPQLRQQSRSVAAVQQAQLHSAQPQYQQLQQLSRIPPSPLHPLYVVRQPTQPAAQQREADGGGLKEGAQADAGMLQRHQLVPGEEGEERGGGDVVEGAERVGRGLHGGW